MELSEEEDEGRKKKATFSFWTEECKLLDYLNSQKKNELLHQEF